MQDVTDTSAASLLLQGCHLQLPPRYGKQAPSGLLSRSYSLLGKDGPVAIHVPIEIQPREAFWMAAPPGPFWRFTQASAEVAVMMATTVCFCYLYLYLCILIYISIGISIYIPVFISNILNLSLNLYCSYLLVFDASCVEPTAKTRSSGGLSASC